MKKYILRSLAITFIIIILYLLFYPVKIRPVAWTPTKAPSLEKGVFKVNNKLAKIKKLEIRGHAGEDIAFKNGFLYTGLEDGKIIKMSLDSKWQEVFADTKGRPLGLMFDKKGNLIVADAYKGLLSINENGKITSLTTKCNGLKFNFTDDLDIASDGKIYFTDASHKYTFKDDIDYPLESGANGRFLVYNPKTKKTKLLLDDLHFANGVALSPNEDFVLVNETLRYRTVKYWLKGEKKGQKEIFIENLPGFPDGILHNGKDTYWIALANPRNATLDALLPYPFWRKVLRRFPSFLLPKPVNYGFILGVDKNAKVLYNFQDTEERFGKITNVVEHGDKLYLGSLSEESIGVFEYKKD